MTLILVGEMLPDVISRLDSLKPQLEILHAGNMLDALELCKTHPCCRLVEFHESDSTPAELLYWPKIFDHFPDGIAVIDNRKQILWHNPQFYDFLNSSSIQSAGSQNKQNRQSGNPSSRNSATSPDFTNQQSGQHHPRTSYTGKKITEIINADLIYEGDKTPFEDESNATPVKQKTTILKINDKIYCKMRVIDVENISDNHSAQNQIAGIIFLRDFTSYILNQNKLEAITNAMTDFGEIAPDEVNQPYDERAETIKTIIRHHIKHTLQYKTIEVRILEHSSEKLLPLVSEGMDKDAENRELYARTDSNGITGWVAATGRGYLCHDIEKDDNYLPGAPGARSSMTIPLYLHGQTIGTMNVESEEISAFNNQDLKFLELFGREVSIGLNNLKLLTKTSTEANSEICVELLDKITKPTDDIFNDTCILLDHYNGDDPLIKEKLHAIMEQTRSMRENIFQIEEMVNPDIETKYSEMRKAHPVLKNKRILYVESDVDDRRAFVNTLQRYGAFVDIAYNGERSIQLSRHSKYDVIFICITLSDTIGYNLYVKLKQINPYVPIIFVKGYGYDRYHNIPDGNTHLNAKLAISKPLNLDLLLAAAENSLNEPEKFSPPLPTNLTLFEKNVNSFS